MKIATSLPRRFFASLLTLLVVASLLPLASPLAPVGVAAASSISYVGMNAATGTSVSLPAFQPGDLAIVFAYRNNNNTAPAGAAGWADIAAANGSNGNSRRLAYRLLQPADTTAGTFTNATHIEVIVLRGASKALPIGSNSSASSATTTITIPRLSTQDERATSSYLVAFAGSRATDANTKSVAGMTTRSGSVGALGLHTLNNFSGVFGPTDYSSTVDTAINASDIVEVLSARPSASGSISYVGMNAATGTSASLPSFQVGDLAIAYAYRNNNTAAPGGATGWTDLAADSGADNNARRIAYRVLQAGDTSAGTFANASAVQVVVLRGTRDWLPVGQVVSGGDNTTTLTVPAIAPEDTGGRGWLIAFGGSKATDANTKNVAGMTTRSGSVGALGLHTLAGPTGTFGATAYDSAVNAAANRTDVLEVFAAPTPGSAPSGQIEVIGRRTDYASQVALPYFQAGDLALAYAYRNNNTAAPSAAAGWTDIATSGGANSNARRLAYRVLRAGDTSAGPFANATAIEVIVLRGASALNPIGASASGGDNTTTLTLPGLTPVRACDNVWVVGFGGSKATDANTKSVAGMTSYSGNTGALGVHVKASQRGTFAAASYDSAVDTAGNRTDTVSVLLPGAGADITSRVSGNWNDPDSWAAVAAAGTISTSSSSTTVTGVGTYFSDEVAVGDRLLLADGTTSLGIVAAVGSNTSLTLTANASSSNANVAFSVRHVPLANNVVTVAAGHAISVPAGYAATAYALTISAAGDSQSVALADASASLTVGCGVTIDQPTNGNNSQLIVDAGTLSVGGSLTLNGTVTNSNRCIRLRITTGSASIAGDLVVNNPGTSSACGNKGGFGTPPTMASIDMSGGVGTLNLAGALSVSNPSFATAGLATTAGAVFNYNGTSAQTVRLPSSANWTYASLRTNNTSAAGATLEAAIGPTKVTGNLRVLSGTLDNGGFAISLADGSTFEVANSAIFKLTGTSAMVSAASGSITKTFGAASTVNYAGSDQTVSAESYGHLVLSGSGTKTAAGALALAGDFTNNGVSFAAAGNTVTFSGGAATQTIGGTADTTFAGLTINKVSGGVTLARSISITGSLGLSGGIVSTAGNTLSISSTGSVSRSGCAAPSSSCFVAGNLAKYVAPGAGVSPTFEIGTGSTYSPLSAVFANVSAGGVVTATVNAGTHPNLASSSISTTKYVTRYWTLSGDGSFAFDSTSLTFNFAAADIAGGGDPNVFIVGRYAASSWSYPTVGTRGSSSTQATGVNGLGSFAVGEPAVTLVAVADSYSVTQDGALAVAAPGVLVNDTAGTTVAAPRPASGPTYGTLTLNADGSFDYTPNAGFSGSDSFTYTITDGVNTSSPATVTITVDTSGYVPDGNWSSSFGANYVEFTMPAYVPAGATLTDAYLRHAYRSYTSGTTCWYFEVYVAGALVGSHGSSGAPVSCNSGTSFVTDQVSLPEINTAARANDVTLRLYVRNSAAGKSEHRLATLTVDYWLANP